MQTTANAPAIVNIEGAKRLEKSAKLAAALLPNLVAAAEALEVARTLGKSEQEFFGEIAQVAKAEGSRTLAIELLGQGMKVTEVARETGLTQPRVSQIKRANSPEFRRAAEIVVEFLARNNCTPRVWNAIKMLASSDGRTVLKAVAGEK